MKNIIVNIIAVAALSLTSIGVAAQDYSTHELSVSLGGLNKMNYSKSEQIDKQKTKFGGLFGIGYTYHINSTIGISTGLEYSTYNSDLKLDYIYNKYLVNDNENEPMIYKSAMKDVNENHKMTYLQLPIMAQYSVKLTDSYSYYASAGIKIGFATSKKYDISVASLSTVGDYEGKSVIINNIPEQGFGIYENLKSKGDLALKSSCMMALETGLKWKLDSKMSLYTGVYFDYSLNDINKKGSSHASLVEYNGENPQLPIVNSVASSAHNSMLENTSIIKSMRPMAIGLKLRLGFSL